MYRPVIAGAKLRAGTTTILPRRRERSREWARLHCSFIPTGRGHEDDEGRQEGLVYDCKCIPYWIDRPIDMLLRT